MKLIKSFLFTSCVLGMVALGQSVSAEEIGQANVSKTEYNTSSRTFDVLVSRKAGGKAIKTVEVAIWSEENGQDDLRWYSSSAISNNQTKLQFNIANHGNRAGNYITHVYTTFTDGQRVGTNLGSVNIKTSLNPVQVVDGQVKISSTLAPPSNAKFQTAVWSDENGQDDIKWYNWDTTNLSVALSNHKGYGTYHVHTYLNQDNKMQGLSGQSFTLEKPAPAKISTQVTKISDKTVDISISGLPNYISSVKIPTWSEVNGQDDLKWYQAQKVGEGNFKVRVNMVDHGFDLGTYHAHFYGKNSQTGNEEGLAATSFTIDNISGLENPVINLNQTNSTQGLFTVSILETLMSKKVTSLKVVVTSKTNVSKTKTYEAKTSNQRANISVDLKQLTTTADNFSVTAYAIYSDNSQAVFNLAEQKFTPSVVRTPQSSTTNSASPRITRYINETNTYPVGQCTWGVKTLAPWIPNYLGNAKEWTNGAKNLGFRTGTTPEVGAIAVWPYDGGGYGHVAYVTAVESSTRIQVKEANYAGNQSIANYRNWFNPTASWCGGGTVFYIYPN